MQTKENRTEIEARIAELRKSYAKLKATCGLRAINKETIEEYAKKLQALQAQMQ